MKKIIPALALLLVSAVLLATSSFAWFSMNTTVTVTGMEVTTKVSSNLLVAEYNTDDTGYATALDQTREALLEPVSTTNAVNFFYHANANIDGSGDAIDTTFVAYSEATVADPSNALADDDAGKTHYDAAFQSRYSVEAPYAVGNVAYGYIDYTMYLKATSDTDNSALNNTNINLLYNGAALTAGDQAWRVAVFKEAVSAGSNGSDVGSMTLVSILTVSGAANFTAGKAATSTTALGDVTYNTGAAIDNDVDAGETVYYKVVVRLWLEGEDNTCSNETYAALTSNYTLDLTFKLDTTSAAATNITSVAP